MSTRKGPLESAKLFAVGTKRKGLDDNMYVIKLITKNDCTTYNRWVKLTNKIPVKRSPVKRSPVKRSPVKRSPIKKLPVKRSHVKSFKKLIITIHPRYIKSDDDSLYEYKDLPQHIKDESLKYFHSPKFLKLMKNILVDDAIITKIEHHSFIDKSFVIIIDCKLTHDINTKTYEAYKTKIIDGLYNASPIKYGKYLGKGKYELQLNHLTRTFFK
jgi:hypothetical protein